MSKVDQEVGAIAEVKKISFKALTEFLDETVAVLEALHWKKAALET